MSSNITSLHEGNNLSYAGGKPLSDEEFKNCTKAGADNQTNGGAVSKGFGSNISNGNNSNQNVNVFSVIIDDEEDEDVEQK